MVGMSVRVQNITGVEGIRLGKWKNGYSSLGTHFESVPAIGISPMFGNIGDSGRHCRGILGLREEDDLCISYTLVVE